MIQVPNWFASWMSKNFTKNYCLIPNCIKIDPETIKLWSQAISALCIISHKQVKILPRGQHRWKAVPMTWRNQQVLCAQDKKMPGRPKLISKHILVTSLSHFTGCHPFLLCLNGNAVHLVSCLQHFHESLETVLDNSVIALVKPKHFAPQGSFPWEWWVSATLRHI